MDVLSAPFIVNELRYNVQYWYSSFSEAFPESTSFPSKCCSLFLIDHNHWPQYMTEMMKLDKASLENPSSIHKKFGISEYILISIVWNYDFVWFMILG